MTQSLRRVGWVGTLWLVGCATANLFGPPPPTPLSLKIPAPPEPVPGTIRVYGHDLPEARAREIREGLRGVEPDVLAAYQTYVASDVSHKGYAPLEGRLQLRVGINAEGKVASIATAYSEVGNGLVGEVYRVLDGVSFAAGPEAWAYDTFRFQPNALEVLKIDTDFAAEPPVVLALVENRSMFHMPAVSATVTVFGPEKAKPLRVYRRRLHDGFDPGDRHELRIPIDGQWATIRNSFFVVVDPSIKSKAKE